MERPFIKRIYEALQSQIKHFTAALREQGIDQARHNIEKILINDSLIEPLRDLFKTFGAYSIRQTQASINKSARFKPTEKKAFGIDPVLLAAIIDYLKRYLLIKVVIPITETTRKQILDALINGTEQGWGADKIAMELESAELTRARALMIVRTESLKALFLGSQSAVTESRWQTETEWIAANDHRTRHSHRDVDGNKIDEGKRFAVPIYRKGFIIGYDFMLGPGDPVATAGNVINCRCSKVTIAKRDDKGRLIPKKVGNSGISVILPQERFQPSQIITI